MPIVCLHDREKIEEHLRLDPLLNVYGLGDLDAPYWDHTTWFGFVEDGGLKAIGLFYSGTSLPVLLVFGQEPLDRHRALVSGLVRVLPRRFHAHLSSGLEEAFLDDYRAEPHGLHQRMALRDPSQLEGVASTGVVRLTENDLPQLHELYDLSYPGHWFEPSMLSQGFYFGIREQGRLESAAGIHVVARRTRVAALGNIATRPDARGRGLARRVTAQLCRELLAEVDHIGLNVKADNAPAVVCYEGLGFEKHAEYGEWTFEAKAT